MNQIILTINNIYSLYIKKNCEKITYDMIALTAETSLLATGVIYLVYE